MIMQHERENIAALYKAIEFAQSYGFKTEELFKMLKLAEDLIKPHRAAIVAETAAQTFQTY